MVFFFNATLKTFIITEAHSNYEVYLLSILYEKINFQINERSSL